MLEPFKDEIGVYEAKKDDLGTSTRQPQLHGNQMEAMRLVGTRVMAFWSRDEIGKTGWRMGKIIIMHNSNYAVPV